MNNWWQKVCITATLWFSTYSRNAGVHSISQTGGAQPPWGWEPSSPSYPIPVDLTRADWWLPLPPQIVDLGLGEEWMDSGRGVGAHGLQVRKDVLHRGIWGLWGRSLLLVLGYCWEALLSNMFTFSQDSAVFRLCGKEITETVSGMLKHCGAHWPDTKILTWSLTLHQL